MKASEPQVVSVDAYIGKTAAAEPLPSSRRCSAVCSAVNQGRKSVAVVSTARNPPPITSGV